MTARIAGGISATAVAAALLLSGCGSDDGGGKTNGDIKGAQAAGGHKDKSQAPPDAPKFDLPADVKVDITADKTGNRTKDAILQAHQYALMAQQESYAKTEPTANFQKYWSDQAAAKLDSVFKAYRKNGNTITGQDRFYFRQVTWVKGKQAEVAYCEDQSKLFDKNVSSGKVNRNAPSLNSYVDVRTKLAKRDGTWQVIELEGQRGSKECRQKA
jgi:hypothetical protein